MLTKEILGANRFENFSKIRIGARGIIIQNGKILLVHQLINDFYMIPGGGQESCETIEDCCARELQEETGFIVTTCYEGPFLQLNEYYEEYKYVGYYYMCEIIGQTEQKLTDDEENKKLVVEWVEFEKALDLFSHHQDFALTYEEKRGAYLREYTALCSVFG